jgi:asparagine synthetase B (glutamine-hydrolysing)
VTAQWVNPADALTPLEIGASVLLGPYPHVRLPVSGETPSPREALEQSLLRALRRPPCLIAFSGGRDSSALLALAAHVAAREGLPKPVPITARYPGVVETDEETWQERVIEHLGVKEWIVLAFADEVDLVGPVARELMLRRGLPYPYNLHLQAPLAAQAAGGSFVTGVGGDEAFMPAARAVAVLAGYVRPTPRDVLRIAAAVAPRSLRRWRLARSETLSFPWLRPEANRMLTRSWIEAAVRIPTRWDASVADWWRSRYIQLTIATLSQLGNDIDVRVHQPFADGAVIAALATAGGTRGFHSRTAALEALFGDLLPDDVPRRATKASFNGVLWNKHSEAFAAELFERGLDRVLEEAGLGGVVEPNALRAHWSGPSPAANSFLVLQACWVALHGSATQNPDAL